MQERRSPEPLNIVKCVVFTLRHRPVGVPRDDVAVEAGRDQETSVGVVLDVLHPAGVAVQRAHLRIQLPQVPQCDRGVVGAGGEQAIVQKPAGGQKRI